MCQSYLNAFLSDMLCLNLLDAIIFPTSIKRIKDE